VSPLTHEESAETEAARLLHLPRGCRLMVVHCDTQPHKLWDNEHWRVSIETFLNRYQNFYAAIVGLSKERLPECARLIDCRNISLSTALAITASADLFVGVDSCMLHAADFARVPSVGLFGPTDPRRFGCRVTPYYRHIVSSTTRMAEIPVADLLTGVDNLISTLGLSEK
jgi:ADP-heptose:LPS heptosyltransferase